LLLKYCHALPEAKEREGFDDIFALVSWQRPDEGLGIKDD
jgi:hypothetical protein